MGKRKDVSVNPNLETLVQSWRQRNTVTDTRGTNMGLQGRVTAYSKDAFQNMLARTGYGTPNLAEGTNYPLTRFTFHYWDLISMFESSWITRKIVEMPAQAMCKAWPRLTSDIDPKDLTKIDRALRRTNSKGKVLTAMTWARLFGGAGALIALKGQDSELDQELDLDSVGVGDYSGLIPFDRWSGITPDGSVCTDMSKPTEFGLPKFYNVRAVGGDSFKVHASRILRFTGPTVPTPEKEAYSAWGISVIEPVLQQIEMYDNVAFNILALSFRANILGMRMPELASMLSGLGGNSAATEKFAQRMQQVSEMLSNQSLVLLPTDGELSATSYQFGGLDSILMQFQLAVSAAAGIPVTRLWGKTYTGLGTGTNEGDERVFEERIAQDQDEQLRPQLEKLYPVICASELGEVPDDLDLDFPSIRVLDETEKSTLAKTVVDTVMVAMNGGIISPKTAAKELKQSSDKTGMFTNITDEDIDKLPDTIQAEGEVGQGLFPEGGGLTPASGPGKVLREENKEGKEDQDVDDRESLEPVKVAGEEEETEDEEQGEDGLGNNRDYKTNARRVTTNLQRHAELMNKYIQEGMTKEEASKRALQEVLHPKRKALDTAPADLKPGDRITVNGKLLTVAKVTTGTADLFGNPTVQVTFTNGRVEPYLVNGDLKVRVGDEANFKESDHPRRKDGKFGEKGAGSANSRVGESLAGKADTDVSVSYGTRVVSSKGRTGKIVTTENGVASVKWDNSDDMSDEPLKNLHVNETPNAWGLNPAVKGNRGHAVELGGEGIYAGLPTGVREAIVEKDLGVGKKEAQKFVRAVSTYSGAGYFDVRSGEDKATAEELEQYISKAPKWDGNGPTYRGLDLSNEDFENLVPGAVVDMKGVSSWSSDLQTAENFSKNNVKLAGKKSCVFEVDRMDHGTSIAHVSDAPLEAEVLVSKHVKFKVVGVQKKTGATYDGKPTVHYVVRVQEAA